jgi:hypothetical protein
LNIDAAVAAVTWRLNLLHFTTWSHNDVIILVVSQDVVTHRKVYTQLHMGDVCGYILCAGTTPHAGRGDNNGNKLTVGQTDCLPLNCLKCWLLNYTAAGIGMKGFIHAVLVCK